MSLPVRVTARAIIADAQNRVLLMQIEPDFSVDPNSKEVGAYWITVGGAVRDGEALEAALARELLEETGLSDITIGSPVDTLEQELLRGGTELTLVRDHFFVVRVTSNEVSTDFLEEPERSVFRGYRWWSLDEICGGDLDLKPKVLKELIPRWLQER
jgi:8-oxo-dGTP pyrophosphatase MutT (NUDIX family)